MTPSMPVRLLKVKFPNSVGLFVKSLIVSMKKRIAKLMNTNCNARFFLSVPKNIANVNSPHMKKYAAIAVSVGAFNPVKSDVLGRTRRSTRDHQKSPYDVKATVPKVLPFLNSIIPTITCANPPYAKPIANIIVSRGKKPALCKVKQNSCHSETQQPKRRRIRQFLTHVITFSQLRNALLTAFAY